MDVLTELSLFSGYGGFTLGLRVADVPVQTVCYVERERYCQQVIRARIKDGHLDDAPIWDDITTFYGTPWRGLVDIITAGFPCQPHSAAGRRLGREDSRNLWPDTLRVIREVEPSYVLLENVRGLADGAEPYAAEVVGGLSEAGYDAVWGLCSAAEAGALHIRDRWWCLGSHSADNGQFIGRWEAAVGRECEEVAWGQQLRSNGEDGDVAHASSPRLEGWQKPELLGQQQTSERGSQNVAHTQSEGLQRESFSQTRSLQPPQGSWWAVEPDVGRVANGVAHRLDLLSSSDGEKL